MSKDMASISSKVLVLEAGRSARHYWRDLWDYRELFAILAWRDLAVRYKQTVIGVAWAVIRPLMTMVIFTIVFGRLAKLPSEGMRPTPLWCIAGMLPWFLFSSILGDASNSIVGNSSLIGKVYFPRIIIPAAAGVVSLVDFGINFAAHVRADGLVRLRARLAHHLLAGLRGPGRAGSSGTRAHHHRAQREVSRLPLHHSISSCSSASTSRRSASPASVVPAQWRFWYSLNPLVGVIDGFRWCLLGGESQLYLPGFALSLVVAAVFLWLGIRVFRRTEKTFADLI